MQLAFDLHALQRQILEQRKAKDAALAHRASLTGKCAAEADRLREVIRFFDGQPKSAGG